MNRLEAWLAAHPHCNVEITFAGRHYAVTLYGDFGERFEAVTLDGAIAAALENLERVQRRKGVTP